MFELQPVYLSLIHVDAYHGKIISDMGTFKYFGGECICTLLDLSTALPAAVHEMKTNRHEKLVYPYKECNACILLRIHVFVCTYMILIRLRDAILVRKKLLYEVYNVKTV